jgi:hypothetical protein
MSKKKSYVNINDLFKAIAESEFASSALCITLAPIIKFCGANRHGDKDIKSLAYKLFVDILILMNSLLNDLKYSSLFIKLLFSAICA